MLAEVVIPDLDSSNALPQAPQLSHIMVVSTNSSIFGSSQSRAARQLIVMLYAVRESDGDGDSVNFALERSPLGGPILTTFQANKHLR